MISMAYPICVASRSRRHRFCPRRYKIKSLERAVATECYGSIVCDQVAKSMTSTRFSK